MSAENVEVVRESLEAFARGDLEAAFSAFDPAAEWTTAADEPDTRTWRGIDGLYAFAASIGELWEDRFADDTEFLDFIDLGDWVVVPWRARLRGKWSGAEVLVEETYAVRLAGGRIVRVEEYRVLDDALAAVRRAG